MDGWSSRRHIVTLVATFALILAGLPLFLPPAAAQEPPLKLFVRIEGRGAEGGAVLSMAPAEIVIGSSPILVNVTFVNNDTGSPAGARHNFRTEIGMAVYETPLIPLGSQSQIEFWINVTGEEIPYWCNVPGHRMLGMEGKFVVGLGGGAPGDGGVQGLALRAYWIGLLGLFSMVAVIILAYFVIKYESRHHADHREHRRRGLP